MDVTLATPMLTGVRADAQRLIDDAGLPRDLRGRDVVIDGHQALAATPTYADELVRIILIERRAHSLTVSLADERFTTWLVESARRHGMTDRLIV